MIRSLSALGAALVLSLSLAPAAAAAQEDAQAQAADKPRSDIPPPVQVLRIPPPAPTRAVPLRAPEPVPESAYAPDDENGPHWQLFDALQNDLANELAADQAIEMLIGLLMEDANFAAAARRDRTILAELRAELRPAFFAYAERGQALMRPEMVGVLRAGLSDDDAASLAEFYRTPLGQRLILLMGENQSFERTLSDALDGGEISLASVQEDGAAAIAASTSQMTPEERAAVQAAVLSNPAFLRLQRISPQMLAIRTRFENMPPNNEERRAIEEAFARAFAQAAK